MKMKIPDDIHEVQSYKDESIPLFDNKLLDFFTRIPWYVVPILYLPVIAYCLYIGYADYELSMSYLALMFFAGLFLWTITEYIFHRFVFHYNPKSERGKRFFFMIHGIHHAYPSDSMRLVLPPAISAPLAYAFYLLFKLTMGAVYAPFFAGFIFGYLSYDMIHYATHHAKFINAPFFLRIKNHHMMHHFQDPDNGFGVSSDIWDKVLNTEIEIKSKKTA